MAYWKFYILLALSVSFGYQPADPPTLHAIYFAQTTDKAIGAACKIDYDNWENEMRSVAIESGMAIQKYGFEGRHASCSNLQGFINQLVVKENDVIWFYYSGHGLGILGNKYPRLSICNGASGATYKYGELSWLKNELLQKGARLTIIFGDLCNKAKKVGPKQAPKDGLTNIPLERTKCYYKLFHSAKGSIIAVAADSGQYAYCSRIDGGYFTYFFIDQFLTHLNNDEAKYIRWDTILRDTQQKTFDWSIKLQGKELIEVLQKPIYDVDVQYK